MKRIIFLAFYLLLWGAYAQEDLVIPSDEVTLRELRETLAGKTDFVFREARRLGNKTLEVDCRLALPGDLTRFKAAATDFTTWRDWALKDINSPAPNEGDYLLQLHDVLENTPGNLSAIFSFNIPFFKNHRARTFKMTPTLGPDRLLLVGETQVSEKSAVKKAKAFLKVFQAEGNTSVLWVNVKAMVMFRSWFLYEALPEKVILREVGDRLHTIAKNYQGEETRRRLGAPPARRETSGAPMPPESE